MEEVGVRAAIGGGLGEDFGVLTEDLDVVEEGPDVSDWEGWRGGRRARLVKPFVVVGGRGGLEGLGGEGGAEGAPMGLELLVHGLYLGSCLMEMVHMQSSKISGSRKFSGIWCI
jgi:hypothetical protein